MFVDRALKAFERETEQMLLFEVQGRVQGLIHCYWIPEDHYLDTVSVNVNEATEQALAEFLMFAGARFKDYELFLGFPAENQAAVNFLAERGFECIEDDYNNIALLEKLEEMPVASGLPDRWAKKGQNARLGRRRSRCCMNWRTLPGWKTCLPGGMRR